LVNVKIIIFFKCIKIQHSILKIKTRKALDFYDITEEVEKLVKESGIANGSVQVFSRHTTVAIRINEQEKGIIADFGDLLNRLIPKDVYYRHNDLSVRTENLVCDPGASDCLNGHSHCTHLFMGTSETIPVIDGKLMLGIWQRVFAIELDVARNRQIILQVIGE
jgi:secondary thiamine-phosphate synthase enzyme